MEVWAGQTTKPINHQQKANVFALLCWLMVGCFGGRPQFHFMKLKNGVLSAGNQPTIQSSWRMNFGLFLWLAAQRGCLVGRSVHFVMPHLLFLHEFHSFHKNKLLSSSISLHYFLIPSQSIHQLSRNARLLSFFNKKSKQSDGIDWGNQWNQSLRGRGALAPITHNNSFFIVAEESYAPPIQQFKKSTTFLQWRRKSWWFIDCWWLRPTSPLNRRAKPGWKVIQLRLHRPFNKETIQLIKEI